MQSCTLCPQSCILFLKEYTVGDRVYTIASSTREKNTRNGQRVHDFKKCTSFHEKEYTISKRVHVDLDWRRCREAERQCIVSLYLKYNLADVKKASTSFDSLIENVYVKRISTIIASWKCGVLILLSCQSMPNGLRYAMAGLRR